MIIISLFTIFCIALWCRYEHEDLNLNLWTNHLLDVLYNTNREDYEHKWNIYVLMRDNVYNRK